MLLITSSLYFLVENSTFFFQTGSARHLHYSLNMSIFFSFKLHGFQKLIKNKHKNKPVLIEIIAVSVHLEKGNALKLNTEINISLITVSIYDC